MVEKYKPYKVNKGKEISVKDKDGVVYAGEYLEPKIKNDEKELALGFYDDPIRGEDEVASIPIKELKYNLLISGEIGYGKSFLLQNMIYQTYLKANQGGITLLDAKGSLAEKLINDIVKDITII